MAVCRNAIELMVVAAGLPAAGFIAVHVAVLAVRAGDLATIDTVALAAKFGEAT